MVKARVCVCDFIYVHNVQGLQLFLVFLLLFADCEAPFVYSDCGAPCEKECALQGRGDLCLGVRECTPGCYCPQVNFSVALIYFIDRDTGHTHRTECIQIRFEGVTYLFFKNSLFIDHFHLLVQEGKNKKTNTKH